MFRSRRAASAFGTVSFGLTLYRAAAIRPAGSITKADRTMPMYFLPYMFFSPQTPYASATVWSGSERSG